MEAHLMAEDADGSGACSVALLKTVVENML
jgi:hypothetical protein